MSSPGPPPPRTTQELVQSIIQVAVVKGIPVDLTPFIQTANVLTTAICTYPNPTNPNALPYSDGYPGSQMELIERWLAAHLYTISDNQLASAKAGTAAVAFQYKIALGLKNSMYGQQAMFLDINGGLAKYSNSMDVERQISVKLLWLGRRRRCWREGDGDVDGWADIAISTE